jgi:hypothetical protein
MSYDFEIQEKQDYMRIEISGERVKEHEVDDSLEVWTRLAGICTDKGIFKVLFVLNLSGDLPMMAAFEIGDKGVKINFPKKMKIALVDLNEKSRAKNYFAETVAVNRSFGSGSMMFDDENKAKEWLLG